MRPMGIPDLVKAYKMITYPGGVLTPSEFS